MEYYYLISTTAESITMKMELLGFTAKLISEEYLSGASAEDNISTIIVEDNMQNKELIDNIKASGKYMYSLEYNGHVIFTDDKFIKHIAENAFKPKKVQYYDNFPEAKMDLAKCYLPAVIRPYGVSDVRFINLAREYGKGIEAIYDSLEKSPHRHVIIESYI